MRYEGGSSTTSIACGLKAEVAGSSVETMRRKDIVGCQHGAMRNGTTAYPKTEAAERLAFQTESTRGGSRKARRARTPERPNILPRKSNS